MVGAVDKPHTDIDYRIAGEHPFLHRFADPLFDGRDILFGNDTAKDFIFKQKAFSRQRLQLQKNMTVLPPAAGLFFMLAFDLGPPFDGLLVGHLRRGESNFHPKFLGQTADDDLEVELSQAGDNGLPGFRTPLQAESGIFLEKTGKAAADLFLVSLCLRLHRKRDHRSGKIDGRKLKRIAPIAKRIAGGSLLELGHSSNITGHDLLHGDLIFPAHGKHLPDPLIFTLVGVVGLRVGVEHSRVDPEVVDPADIGVGQGLVDQGGKGLLRRRFPDKLLSVIRESSRDLTPIGRRGEKIFHKIKQHGAAQVGGGGGTEYRSNLAGEDAAAQTLPELSSIQCFTLQIFQEQFIVRLGDRFDQFLPHLSSRFAQLLRDLLLLRFFPVIREQIRFFFNQIDDPLEVLLLADRKLHGNNIQPKITLQLLHSAIKIGIFPIKFVDHNNPGQAEFIGILPHLFSTHFYPGNSAYHHHAAISHTQSADQIADKIKITGCIQKIDLHTVPF